MIVKNITQKARLKYVVKSEPRKRLSEKGKKRLLVNAFGQALRGLELEKTKKH